MSASFARFSPCKGPRYRSYAGLLLAAVLMTACGTRVGSQEAQDRSTQAAGASSSPTADPSATPVSADPVPAPAPADAPPSGSGAAAAPAAPTAAGAAAAPTKTAPRPSSGSGSGSAGSQGATTPTSGRQSGSGGASRGETPAKGNVAPPVPQKGGPKAPIVLANVGTYSGPFGASIKSILQGTQAWVKLVSGRGGLNGHPVNFVVFDDGGDPARHRAMLQQAVEQYKAIAFVGQGDGVTGYAGVEYLTGKRVPVVGGDGTGAWWVKSPMYFPQMAYGDAFASTAVASIGDQMVPKGTTKLGITVCTEAQTCENFARASKATAPKAKMQVVWEAKVSVAQPDYTAECLSARNAGVQVLFIGLDVNSISRYVSSCSRQGFSPIYSTASVSVADDQKKNAQLDDKMVAGSPIFPWFQATTPATLEYQQAVKAANVPSGVGAASGWTAGKLFERVAANLPDNPTSNDVLRGLWSLKNDDLGGLTYPLTYTENQVTQSQVCWFNMAIQKGAWVTPDAYKIHCL